MDTDEEPGSPLFEEDNEETRSVSSMDMEEFEEIAAMLDRDLIDMDEEPSVELAYRMASSPNKRQRLLPLVLDEMASAFADLQRMSTELRMEDYLEFMDLEGDVPSPNTPAALTSTSVNAISPIA